MNIVAVTACATGVAHTFMAKRAIEDAAKKRGHDIKVETQGATGIEDALTPEDLKAADILILATDIKLAKMERFDQVKKVTIPVSTAIKNANGVIKRIEEKLES
ncbi:PTS system, fructose-specific IIB component [Alkalibacterium sp. AK22]|uniref:PTS fructose transporter subunit IIB n=1 Tax=Alkalibacterium sp. AK22 TaxID=1229520 RepID=UPI00044505B5|nr:fructose PTS transporter subunit IIB [Alkalibacterium sp. AK22]EXJ24309.1 PTS system, fructose-specific IIB component [Alkalibacterium sp. AK22]